MEGWMAPDGMGVVEEAGQAYVQFEVNHSGVVQLGRRIPVQVGGVVAFDVGAEGSRRQWVLFCAVVLALGVGFAFCSLRLKKTA